MYERVSFDRNKALIEDFTEVTLAAIPSDYGRLLYLSTLRDLATGRYVHSGLEEKYSEGAVHEVLDGVHHEIVIRILETPLDQQAADLGRCLDNLPGRSARAGEAVEGVRVLPSFAAARNARLHSRAVLFELGSLVDGASSLARFSASPTS